MEEIGYIYICKKVNYDYCYENTDEFLASIVWEQNHLEVIYCQGGEPDVEQYFAEISLKSSFPKKIELPTDFNINSKSCKQIQVVTYVDQSSKIKYHFELETIGSKKFAFCGAQRTPMRFRADAVRSITDALIAYYSQLVSGLDHYGVVLCCPFQYRIGRYLVIEDHRCPAVWLSLRAYNRAP